MRETTGIFGNAPVVGEPRNCFYVRERRPTQRQPFGLEDARTGLAQGGGRDILQHGRLRQHVSVETEKGRPVSRLPFGAFINSAGSSGPGGLVSSTVYSAAASVIGRTDTKVRPPALARNST